MYLLGLRYLEALPKLAEGKGSTIFLPSEATGVLGAVGGIRELLRATAGDAGGAARERGMTAPTPSLGYSGPRTPALRSGKPGDSEPDR